MKRASLIHQELNEIHTVEDLTAVFEGIASIHIARIRDRVVVSKAFFTELWQTYQGLRVNPKEQLTRHKHADRDVYVIVTAEGRLSGQIDEKIVETMRQSYPGEKEADVIAIGSQGVHALKHLGITPAQAFQLPVTDVNFSVAHIAEALSNYRRISVFYQTYESLRVQKVAFIELVSAVRELGESVSEDEEVMSSRDYIFEPNIDEIADYMESVMMGVALIQIIMETKLAQYAGRYNTMNAAKHRAGELLLGYRTAYHRARRNEGDERLKEVMKVVKHRGNNRAY